ncbi:MAG: alpha/beta hydrolase [Chloroflexi bacterium]|nr:alpha/beta hydrolase [Chloroflexota bacterium]
MQQPAVKQSAPTGAATKHELMIKGANITVYEQGQGAPLLFLHGSPDNHAMWLPLIEHLSRSLNARFIAPDLPGFGNSTLPANFPLTLDNEADFIRALLGALNVTEPVTLVVTDFGGHYGSAFAVKYPDLVRGMVISNTNFFREYDWHSFAKLYRVPLLGELLIATPKAMLDRSLKQFAPALPQWYIDESFAPGFGSPRVRKAILRYYRERNAQDFAGWDDKLLALLQTKPALVLWGDKDPFIAPTFGDRWGKAQVKHFSNNSHWLALEATTDYGDAILQWLESLQVGVRR